MKGEKQDSALTTALAFGYADTAEALVRRGAQVDNVASAAGLGRLDDFERLLPEAKPEDRHRAVALAAIHGRTARTRRAGRRKRGAYLSALSSISANRSLKSAQRLTAQS
jgi:hypothetical protein